MFVLFYLSKLYVLNQDRSSESFTWSRMWCRESLLSTAGGNSKCLYSCMRLLTTGCSVCKSKSKFSWLIISNSENCKTSYSHCSLRASSPEYIQIPEMQLQALLPFPALLPECPQRSCWQATVTVETSTCKETTKNNCFTKNNSGMLLCHKGEANQTWDTVPLKSMLAAFHVSILKSWDWIFNSWV